MVCNTDEAGRNTGVRPTSVCYSVICSGWPGRLGKAILPIAKPCLSSNPPAKAWYGHVDLDIYSFRQRTSGLGIAQPARVRKRGGEQVIFGDKKDLQLQGPMQTSFFTRCMQLCVSQVCFCTVEDSYTIVAVSCTLPPWRTAVDAFVICCFCSQSR